MKRNELETLILEEYKDLTKSNLKNLRKEHLEDWVNKHEVTLSTDILVKIFSDRNQRAAINERLNRENVSLVAKVQKLSKSLTDWSKSEFINYFKKVFGTVTKADDETLGEIGAVSKESVREDLEKAEQAVDDAMTIAKTYPKKYSSKKNSDL